MQVSFLFAGSAYWRACYCVTHIHYVCKRREQNGKYIYIYILIVGHLYDFNVLIFWFQYCLIIGYYKELHHHHLLGCSWRRLIPVITWDRFSKIICTNRWEYPLEQWRSSPASMYLLLLIFFLKKKKWWITIEVRLFMCVFFFKIS